MEVLGMIISKNMFLGLKISLTYTLQFGFIYSFVYKDEAMR